MKTPRIKVKWLRSESGAEQHLPSSLAASDASGISELPPRHIHERGSRRWSRWRCCLLCSLLQVDIREERVEHHHEQTQGGKEVRGKEGKRERTKRGGIKYSFRVAMSRQDHFPVTRDPPPWCLPPVGTPSSRHISTSLSTYFLHLHQEQHRRDILS